MSRWQRYWFRAGGRTSAAAVRIAIGLSIFWMLLRLADGRAGAPEEQPHALYRALGILRLWPGEPGETVFAVVWPLAWASTVLMIVGLASRASAAISFVTTLVIASYEYSFTPAWSHDLNASLLAQLAFLGARGGDALSLDALVRRWRGRATPVEHSYLWSVLLVQLALGLMMASAAFSKLVSGGPRLAWVLSDNLRNHMLVRFDLSGIPRPPLTDWIMAEPWRWQLTAGLNLVAQLAPLVACFLTRRPVWRMLFGSLFAIETIALDHVMGFSNYHWLPLAAAFVDWDWLAAKVRRAPPATQVIALPGRAARTFVAAFVACDLVIAFWRWPKIDQRIGAYPLSNFPMFASIRAYPPYGEHRTYEIVEGGFEVVTEPPLPDAARRWVHANPNGRGLHRVRDRDELRGVLEHCRNQFMQAFPGLAVRSVRANLIGWQAPPYPEPARFDRVDIATLAELLPDGTMRSAFGAPLRTDRKARVVVDAQGLPPIVGFARYVHAVRSELSADRTAGAAAEDWQLALPDTGWLLARVPVPGEGDRWFVVAEL